MALRTKSKAQRLWLTSARFDQIRKSALTRARLSIAHRKKCGALARHSQQPCKNFPLTNGRCRFHGGKTPKGNQWHVVQMPSCKTSQAKADRKLDDLDRRAAQRRQRIRAMTADQAERYQVWQQTHKAGSATQRDLRRHEKLSFTFLAELKPPPRNVDPELEALLQRLRQRKADLETMLSLT